MANWTFSGGDITASGMGTPLAREACNNCVNGVGEVKGMPGGFVSALQNSRSESKGCVR